MGIAICGSTNLELTEMKWIKVDEYHGRSENKLWTIAIGPLDLPKPFGLFFKGKLVNNFSTKEEAKAEAEMMEGTQA